MSNRINSSTNKDLESSSQRIKKLVNNHAKFVCFVVVCKSFFTCPKTTISPTSVYIMTVLLSLFSSFFFLYLYIRDIMVPKYRRWYSGTKKAKEVS